MEFLNSLASQGVLGLFNAIQALAIIYLFKLLIDEKNKRIEDARQTRDSILEPFRKNQEILSEIKTLLSFKKR